jgi:ribonucleoside-diphosphate reductase alpha chain
MVLGIRRIGLGIGGWADMLIELGVPYDSQEALKLAEKVMKTIQDESVKTSQELAKERGPFPLWPVSIYKNQKPRRNSTVTTIAPTGSISIIAGASSGIEPLFAIAYQHVVKDKSLDRTLTFVNSKFEEIAKEKGFWTEELKKKIAKQGTARGVKEIPPEIKEIFGTAHEIHHDWHIKMQAAFQKYTENAVSKTINMENGITVKDVKKVYLLAWETNCKGITVFRDGCKDTQVLNLGVKTKEKGMEKDGSMRIRPFKVSGSTYRLRTPVGTAFVTINENEKGEPLEIFINVGKAGSDVAAMAEALGRTISTTLRFRSDLSPIKRAKEIAFQLSSIGGRRSVGFGPNKIRSLPDAIAVALSNHFGFKINGNGNHVSTKSNGEAGANLVAAASAQAGQPQSLGSNDPTSAPAFLAGKTESKRTEVYAVETFGDICPSCGASALVFEEGCSKCYACGHSEC